MVCIIFAVLSGHGKPADSTFGGTGGTAGMLGAAGLGNGADFSLGGPKLP